MREAPDGTVLLCLHRWGAHEHPSLMNPDEASPGNGLLLFFRVDDYEMAPEESTPSRRPVRRGPPREPEHSNTRVSLRDPDGYHITITALSAPELCAPSLTSSDALLKESCEYRQRPLQHLRSADDGSRSC